MTRILIAPYAARLFNGKPSPKDYPYFPKLVELLNNDGYEVVQIGVKDETKIEGVAFFITDLPLYQIPALVNECATWISVDSMLPHLCYYYNLKPGIVLFGTSDPRIWGHSRNINLLRGRDFLRPYQYQNWEAVEPKPSVFMYAENIMPHVYKLAVPPLVRRTTLVSYVSEGT